MSIRSPEYRHARDGAAFIEPLTEREAGVLRLAAQGKTNREIGQALAISHRTVQDIWRDIYDSLHVQSQLKAVTGAAGLDDHRAGG